MLHVRFPVALSLGNQGKLACYIWKYGVKRPTAEYQVGKGHLDRSGTTSSGHSPGAALKRWDMLIPSALCCISGLHLELAKVSDLLT